MPRKAKETAPAVQSALHLTGKGEAPDAVAKYQPPKRNKGKKSDVSQRNEKGQFVAGNTAALIWTEDKAMELANALLDWMKEKETKFLLKDFLFQHDLYADIIATLCDRYPPFAENIARAKEIEAHRIQKFALTNNLNSGMAQWILAVHHNQHNVQKQEVNASVSVAPPPIIVFEDEEDILTD